MEAKDIFGEEPDSDELSETPSAAALAEPGLMPLRVSLPDHLANDQGDLATPKQIGYINGLLANKKVNVKLVEEIESKLGLDVDVGSMTKRQASFYISQLVQLPNSEAGYAFPKPSLEELPAGHYAITNEKGELRFYQVWRATKYGKPDLIKVYVQHGPDDSEIPFRSAMVICKRIVAEGPLVCAQKYGREIGSCYRCGRRLTNRISRQLGIGPICGNRDFGSEFKNLEVVARREIIGQGHDPDEVIEIDSEQ